MKRLAIVLVALAGCAPQPAPRDGMATGDNASTFAEKAAAESNAMMATRDPFSACDGGKANALLGKPVDAALRAEAMRLVGAALTRVVAPGAMVTMDYRGNRLNIDTDAANKAVRFHCG